MKHVPGKIKDKYDILGIIGEGAYGVVLKARKKNTNTVVAIKYFKQVPGYSSDVDVIERELTILQSLRFENVVELIEWFRDKKRCFLVFEYVEWNMLQVLQVHPEGLPFEQVRHLSYQLFSAIYWCHVHEIIHRDIKPENLLISKNFTLKLCDFGFARFCNTQTTADYYTDYVATRWYRSPELLIGSPYGKPVDVWACGCIMAELATGQALFAGESDIDQLYRIQKCLGPLPAKYVEAMRSNPKFEGLKFPSIHQLDTLERRLGHVFPPDMMHLFKHTLRLYATDRLTAEKCLQHNAFISLNQKRLQQQRPKTVYAGMNTSQSRVDHSDETVHVVIPLADSRLSTSCEGNEENPSPRRPSPLYVNNGMDISTDVSFATSSSHIQPMKYRSNTQLTDRSSSSHRHQTKVIRAQSRIQSSSSDEQVPPPRYSSKIIHDTSDEDEDGSNNILLRRKYLRSQQSLGEQQVPASPPVKYASNGVLLRSKQQNSTTILQTSSNDMGKKFKRFSLDQYLQIPDSNIYRSSMATVSHAYDGQMTTHQNTPGSFKQIREEPTHEAQRPNTREIHRDLIRSRTVDCHPTIEMAPGQLRTSSRQTQILSDSTDRIDVDSTVSSTYQTSRNLEQQNRYPWNAEQRGPVYGSDSHLITSTGHHTTFNRSFYAPMKNDYIHPNKVVINPQRDPSYDPTRSAKVLTKKSMPVHSKTPIESNRKQQSSGANLFGVYPFARTAMSHVANVLMPSSHQRQPSSRVINSKSRHQDR